MSKVIEAITEKMSAEAAKEFREAVKGLTLLDNSNGDYVSRGKADAERGALEKERDGLKKSLDELQQSSEGSNATVEELKKKLKEAMDAHKTEVADLKAAADRDKKTARIKQALTQAGAWDADLAFTAMSLDLDKLEYDDKENLIGLSDRIKSLQEDKVRLFDMRNPQGTHLPSKGGSAGNPWKKENFNLTEQGKLLRENPARAQALAAEAGITLQI